ncbi:MAG TPA: LPS assembly protein LptD [Acidobacteriaceae bacterium]|nr:LPS assembly protein LptD [Acidobacteriaceae bacterium]
MARTQSFYGPKSSSGAVLKAETARRRPGAHIVRGIFLGNIFLSITITLLFGNPLQGRAQQVTTEAHFSRAAQTASESSADGSATGETPAAEYPEAEPITASNPADQIHLYTAPGGRQTGSPTRVTLEGGAEIDYRSRVLMADKMEYDRTTGDVTLTGHVVLNDSEDDVRIEASHGEFNVHTQTGRFFDVTGSMGLKRRAPNGTTLSTHRAVYENGNPFLFTGRVVMKTGPRNYSIYDGTVTSCQLARPDWLLSASEFAVEDTKAHARNTVFHLRGLPLLWLPYVTHPVDTDNRQSGILIPEIGINSASKGSTIGEQVYWAINRSTDLTAGFLYYSQRGWEQTAGFRYRGLDDNFARVHYSNLQDRGYYSGGVKIDQSGTDVTFSGRYDADAGDTHDDANPPAVQTRAAGDVEYLSSFAYREAFSLNFNQAVSSDVNSVVYAIHEWNGIAASLEGDRYQGEKRVANTKVVPVQQEQQVRIFHAPALEFTTTDHRLGSTGLEWNVDGSATALKRVQPNFASSGMVERVDVRPELAYPLHVDGWDFRPSVAGRETFYTRSRLPGITGVGVPPTETKDSLNRLNLDVQFQMRPPVLERDFTSGLLPRLLGHEVRHTIEPAVTYRYVSGVDNYSRVLRFDTTDIVSDTNEIEYSATQRLFLRRNADEPCRDRSGDADALEVLGSAGSPEDAVEDPGQAGGAVEPRKEMCGSREWISWRLAQRYFFNENFGGAVNSGPRTILATTLDFSGISFLTRPRSLSPLTSRLRVRTSEHTDLEWDFDYDYCAVPSSLRTGPPSRGCDSRFTSNNLYMDVHRGNLFTGIGYARLFAPGRSYVEGLTSAVAEFNQMRVLLGFGRPTRPGLSAAAYAGLDLDLGTVQYGAVQTSYNWNCCGLSVEYRKYELGTTRNDNGYRFNFTLANIGSAGNLRHANQIF